MLVPVIVSNTSTSSSNITNNVSTTDNIYTTNNIKKIVAARETFVIILTKPIHPLV